jgi:hypothetical protein
LLLFPTRDIFTQRRHDMMSTVIGGFGVIFGAIADRAAAAASRESAGERAEPLTLALVNMAVQNQAHQAAE